MNPTAADAECITHERAYQILASSANYCMVFKGTWDAHDEISSMRHDVIKAAGYLPMTDADYSNFCESNLAKWQYIRRLSGGGEIKEVAA